MSERELPSAAQLSRRCFLQVAAVGGSAAIASTIIATPAAAATKVPQKSVGYQSSPKGAQRCDNCAFWQTPSSCKLVDGSIDPAGWCSLYRKK